MSTEKSAQLYVKSFFAASIPEAMAQAQKELGSDALLLNSREAPPEARHLGEYEVVFGAWPETAPVIPIAAPTTRVARNDELHQRLAEIRQMIGRIGPQYAARPAEDPGVARALIDAGVETELARSIEQAVRKRVATVKGAVVEIAQRNGSDPQSLLAATADELASRFEVKPVLGRITALVGPPGAGKTTTLVKLAVNEYLQKGRAVRLVTCDTMRIGAAEQLRTYAAILGVSFQAVESTVALGHAIESTPANTALLIDTPGLSGAMQRDLGGDLAQFLARRQDIDTHLVLTASMERADLRSMTDRFRAFKPSKLLFTRLDETTSSASIFSEAARTKMPLSFFAHGQSIPEDLQEASKDQVIDSLVSQLPDALQAVA